MMIKGGYILQPRIIQESDISTAPPYVREIWSYLLRNANSSDVKYNGHEIKRGQLFRSYEDIREGTKWFIGWRKMTYNENQTKKAMKFLRDTLRIGTTKELGGVLITICNYDYYQEPKNYERTTKDPMERTIEEPLKNHPLPDNNKNEKNKKNNKEENKEGMPLEFGFERQKVDYEFIVGNFHELCPKMAKVSVISEARKKSMNARFGEHGIEKITLTFRKAGESNFLNGINDRAWKADFDWLMNPNNFIKVMEGKYQNKNVSTDGQLYVINPETGFKTLKRAN